MKTDTAKTNTYFGGKGGTGTYQQIINHTPPHDIYIAPFAGHDAVFRKIKRARVSILNDINPEVCRWWKKHQEQNKTEETYSHLYQSWLFEKPKKPIVIITNEDFQTIVNRYKDNPAAFIYIDPPYPLKARRSKRKRYTFEFGSDEQHAGLLTNIKNARANIMISTYPNDIYTDLLKDWQIHSFTGITHGKPATELIYMNYDRPKILHDYRYIGENKRRRTEIKRQVKRWHDKLQKMEPQRRTAIISSIINHYSDETKKLIEL